MGAIGGEEGRGRENNFNRKGLRWIPAFAGMTIFIGMTICGLGKKRGKM